MQNIHWRKRSTLTRFLVIRVLAVGAFSISINADTFRSFLCSGKLAGIITVLVTVDMHKLNKKVNITVINFAITELPSRIGIDSIHEKLSLLLYSIMMSIYLLVNPFHTPQPFLAIISDGFFQASRL